MLLVEPARNYLPATWMLSSLSDLFSFHLGCSVYELFIIPVYQNEPGPLPEAPGLLLLNFKEKTSLLLFCLIM